MHHYLTIRLFVVTILTALLSLPVAAQEETSPKKASIQRSKPTFEELGRLEYRASLGDQRASSDPALLAKSPGSVARFGNFATDQIHPLSLQDPEKFYAFPALLELDDGDVLMAYRERGPISKIWVSRTSDGGVTWEPAVAAANGDALSLNWLTLTRTPNGRILLADEAPLSPNSLFYSDDMGQTWHAGDIDDLTVQGPVDWPSLCGQPYNGSNWIDGPGFNTEPIIGPVGSVVWHVYSDLEEGTVKYVTSEDGLTWSEEATMLENPDAASSYMYLEDIIELDDGSLLAAFMKLELDGACTPSSAFSRSADGGATWSELEPLNTGGLSSALGQLARMDDGSVWYVFQDVLFDLMIGDIWEDERFPKSDLHYSSSSDGGVTWSAPEPFTRFAGMDIQPRIAASMAGPLVAFVSNRYLPGDYSLAWDDMQTFGGTQIWLGSLIGGGEQPNTMPPIVEFNREFHTRYVTPEEDATVTAIVSDETDLKRVWIEQMTPNGSREVEMETSTDLQRVDYPGVDLVWRGSLGSIALGDVVDYKVWAEDHDGNRVFSNRSRWDFLPRELISTQLFSQPRHDVGQVCLNMTSAVMNQDYAWWMQRQSPRSGFLGAYPINFPYYVLGALTWPCPDGNSYLYEGSFIVGFVEVGSPGDYRIVGYRNSVGWSETARPVAYSGWSDQDFRLRYEDTRGYGLVVTQESHQFAGEGAEDAVFLEYTVRYAGQADTLEDVELALYLDPDVGWANDELAEYDPGQQVLYLFDDGQDEGCDCGPGTVAMALVSDQEPAYVNIKAPNYGDHRAIGIDPALSAGDPVGTQDVRGTVGISVSRMAPGDEVKVAFVVIMAHDRVELLSTKLPRARELYAARSESSTPPPAAAHFVSPLPYDSIWAGDSSGADPNSLLSADFVWEVDAASKTQNLTYRVELDAYPEFGKPLEAEAGSATKVAGAFSQGDVAASLEELGVELFDNSIMYARVVASDGLNETYGPLLPLTFRLGKIGTAIESGYGIPEQYALHANYPNPFNPSTTIRFDLPRSGDVALEIFDVLGRKVETLVHELLPAGRHLYRWDAPNVASGLYIYRLAAGDFVTERTLLLLR